MFLGMKRGLVRNSGGGGGEVETNG